MNLISNIINVSWIIPGISQILLFIDGLLLAVLEGIVSLVFIVGNFNLAILTEAAGNLINNIQNLIGIYILFKASLLFIQYLVDPDLFKDKVKGGESFLKSIIIVVVLLTLLGSNLLFGVLNDIQKVIFSTNPQYEVLGTGPGQLGILREEQNNDMIKRLIFGGTDLGKPEHFITVKIAEQFLFVCEITDINAERCDEGRNWYNYPTPSDDFLTALSGLADPAVTLGSVAHAETPVSFFLLATIGTGLQMFANIQYTAIISTVFIIFMILKFAKIIMHLVMRFFKLFLMQVLSPIAIVSYATPDGKKTFENFWKTYFSLYFELFLRLFIVYFSIYLMSVVLSNLSNIQSTGNFITELVLRIVLLIGISKFMDEMPELVASLFGKKLGDPKSKSLLNIFGGALGGGIGMGVGFGAARAAGVTGFGALANAGLGLFNGAKSGVNAQNVGSFVSGQVANASKTTNRGLEIANAGGLGSYVKAFTNKTFGGANSLISKAGALKSQAEHDKQSLANLDAVKSAAERRYLKDTFNIDSDKGSYINTKLGNFDRIIEEYNQGKIDVSGLGMVREVDADGNYVLESDGSYKYTQATSIDDVIMERERMRTAYGDEFDEQVSMYMDKQIAAGEENMHPQLRQAYQNYNDYEENYAKTHPDYTPVRIKSGTVVEKGKTKFKHTFKYTKDNASNTAHNSQKAYAEFVSSQDYQNVKK